MRKIIDQFGNIGLILLLLGWFNYMITDLWDWKSQAGVYGGAILLVIFLAVNFAKVRAVLSSRTARMGGTALATLILVLGILALLNFLNFRHHERYDLSEGGLYSLSDQTRSVLNSLEQDVEIIGFFEDESGAARFQDQVQEFRFITDRVEYEIVDPLENPGRVNQYQVTRNGQVVVSSGARREILEDVNEEKITNAIIKVTRDEQKVVYFLTGHGERDVDDQEAEGYSVVREEIEKQNYQVESFNLAQENALPEEASVIVSAGPRVNFFPHEVDLIRAYLDGGGKFLLLVDPEPDSEFSMNDFLGQYGLNLENDFVVDATGVGQLFGFGAGAPLAGEYPDHPITEDLEGAMTIFPAARSVSTVESSLDYSTQELVLSSPQSWGETRVEGESVQFDEGEDREGPVPLAAVATREIEAAESSEDESEGGGEDSGATEPEEDADPLGSQEARLILFGDSDFAANAYFGTSVNSDLFLNSVSWLAEDADLISVRPKDPENRTITLTGSESRLIFWATVVFFPLATLVLGVAVWYRRR